MKLSVQLYTVRDDMAKDPLSTLKAVRETGLNYVEIGGTYGMPKEDFKRALDDLGLRVSGSHAGLDALESDLDNLIEEAKFLGNPWIGLAWIPQEIRDAGWDVLAARLESIGEKCRAKGVGFGYHNHDFEFREQQHGEPGWHVLFENAPNLTAQLDTYWCAYGGYDPATEIRRLKGRIPQVHLKDGTLGAGKPIYLAGGDGDLEWDGILAACEEAGVEYASIELDESPGAPMDSVRRSVEFFRKHGITE